MVDIGYAEQDGGRWRAFLRWTAADKLDRAALADPLAAPPADAPSVFDLADAPDALDKASEPFVAWIGQPSLGDPGQAKLSPPLEFVGGLVFDQLDPVRRQAAHDLRLPLLWHYVLDGAAETSEVRWTARQPSLLIGTRRDAGDATEDHFRFNLGLPMPLPHTRLAPDRPRVPVLPIGLLFKAWTGGEAEIGLIDSIVLGQMHAGPNHLVKRLADLVKTPRLGSFILAPNDRSADASVLSYRKAGVKSADLEKYWPLGDKEAGKSLTDRLWLSGGRPRTETGADVANFHLSLCTPSVFGYRTTLTGMSGASAPLGRVGAEGRRSLALGGAAGRLHVDLDCRWTTADAEILAVLKGSSPNAAGLDGPTVMPLIAFTEKLTSGGSPDKIQTAGQLLELGFRSLDATREALEEVERGQPQSALVELSLRGEGQSVRLALVGLPVAGRLLAAPSRRGAIDFDVAVGGGYTLALADAKRHVEFGFQHAGADTVLLRLRLPGLHGALTPKHVHARLTSKEGSLRDDYEAAGSDWNSDVPLARFGLDQADADLAWDAATHAEGLSARLGALEFARSLFDGAKERRLLATSSDNDGSVLTLLSRRPSRLPARDDWRPGSPALETEGRLGFDLRLLLAIDAVRPVTWDEKRGTLDRRPSPILLSRAEVPAAGDRPPFVLRLTERVEDERDRRLTAELYDRSEETGNTDAPEGDARTAFTLIASEPFAVMRFWRQRLDRSGDEERDAVAVFDSATRLWQFRALGDYRYVLPPASIGESADKPGRLEIHDRVPMVTGGDGPLPPMPQASGAARLPADRRAYPVEFRLTPSAELTIRPSDVERGFLPAEWAAHDIFRQSGALGLGAALRRLRAEFLYGLPVEVDPRRESGPGRAARVAEVEALTGRPRRLAPTIDQADVTLQRRWAMQRPILESRQQRLELWVADSQAASRLRPARFTDGAHFALRTRALLRHPVAGLGENDGPPAALRFHEQGLSGGALWPLESANVARSLLERPSADRGTIERIALSPLGGDADQTVVFRNGIVRIVSETRGGHVQRHRVEVLGRIAALWHRAKHVVVYARTVNPSAQFAPTLAEDPDRTRTRRPAVRKVEEYIELIEPVRRYPDQDAAHPRSSGFLHSVRFNSAVIRVDGAWGEEVDRVGWKIPLWNPLAARLRPQVYPRPDIAFVSAAEGDEDEPLVAQACLDTENLFFFTDTEAGGDETDAWLPRAGIDGAAPPAPMDVAAGFEAPRAGDADSRAQRVVPAPRLLPGYRRFTWRLAPAGRRARINAARGDTRPVFAGVESVTLMRGRPPGNGLGALLSGRVAKSGAGLAEHVGKVAEERLKAPAARLDALRQRLTDAAEKARDAIEDVDEKAFREAKAEFDKARSDFLGALSGEAETIRESLPGLLKDGIADLRGRLGDALPPEARDALKTAVDRMLAGDDPCAALTAAAREAIFRKRLLVEREIRDRLNQVRAAVEAWNGDSTDDVRKALGITDDTPNAALVRTRAVAWVQGAVQGALAPALETVGETAGLVMRDVERARGVVRDAAVDVEALLRRARVRLAALRQAYDDGKPWSDDRLRRFHAALAEALGGLGAEVDEAAAEARRRLALEVDMASGVLAGGVGALLAAKARGVLALDTTAGQAALALRVATAGLRDVRRRALDDLLPRIRAALDAAFVPAADPARQALTKIQTALETNAAKGLETFEATTGLLTEDIRAAAEVLKIALQTALEETEEGIGSLHQTIAHWATSADKILAREHQAITEASARLGADVGTFGDWAFLRDVGKHVDEVVDAAEGEIDRALGNAQTFVLPVLAEIDAFVGTIEAKVGALAGALSAKTLETTILAGAVVPAADLAFGLVDDATLERLVRRGGAFAPERARLLAALDALGDRAASLLETLTPGPDAEAKAAALCADVGGGLKGLAGDIGAGALDAVRRAAESLRLPESLGDADASKSVQDALDRLGRLLDPLAGFDAGAAARRIGAVLERLIEDAANLGEGQPLGGLDDVLRNLAASIGRPALAMLEANRDRLLAFFGDIDDRIDLSSFELWLDRLGDRLKALGIRFPTASLADWFRMDQTAVGGGFDLGALFGDFGGLRALFDGWAIPDTVRDAVRITHGLDKKQRRAWVQADVDAPLPGLRELFAFGPFACTFRDARLTGRLRLEAGDDLDVTESGVAAIDTTIEFAVGGETMVTIQKARITYSKEEGLRLHLEPSGIRINRALQFIQDMLAGVLGGGEEEGPLRVIKEAGLPVGLEHAFELPELSLMAGTSGVSNITIGNRFRLIAHPDFVIANRFNLSSAEKPFLFTIFVIGGAGYIQVDAEYRPFDKRLTVAVEASAGGSAALGFSLGPVRGSVFITLSVAIGYRKTSGEDGVLTLSAVLVIAGGVSLWNIAHVGLVLMLRMDYRDNGDIDAKGRLSVSLRVSRFLKLKFNANVTYRLRDGRSTKEITSKTDVATGADARTLAEMARAAERARG